MEEDYGRKEGVLEWRKSEVGKRKKESNIEENYRGKKGVLRWRQRGVGKRKRVIWRKRWKTKKE